jgi:TonB family protein
MSRLLRPAFVSCPVALLTLFLAPPARSQSPPGDPAVMPAATAILDRDGPPTLKTFFAPRYPEEGRQHNVGGTVTLRLQIDQSGSVTAASVEHGLGPVFDEAAKTAAMHLEFHPAREQGRAVPATIEFEFRFTPPGHTHTGATAPPGAIPVDGGAPILLTEVESVTVVESVDEERPLTAASARTVRDRDLRLRPIQRPADLFRVTPGLMVVQHAGGGKANQYLLRGFDADHGTDVAFTFDGLPLNMVSHGHGQGYSDPNWIIPELVERVEISKGPYFVENGDFSTAGSVDLTTRDRSESYLSVGGGSFDTVRAVTIAAPTISASWHPLLAAEMVRTNGPFQNPENFKKYNLYGKLTHDIDARSRISLAATAYSGSWNASGQLPTRTVNAGLVDFFGTLDPTEGGVSSRENLYVTYRLRPDNYSELNALVYLTHYDFTLYSNFTFFSRDPVNGDEIEQWDSRSIGGGRTSYRWLEQWQGILFDSTVGGSARADSIANGLAHDHARERLAKVFDDQINESSVGLYAKEEVQLARWLRLVAGLRLDHFTFRVDDHLEDLATQQSKTSGVRGASQVSPKASLIVSPHATTDLFANFGYGFHSNDARGVVRGQDPVTPLTRTLGYEVGARSRLFRRKLELAVSLWGLDIDSETVWVGDEGTTEASGATRRLGLEAEGRWEIRPWLFADADVTFSDARFRENAGNGKAVALAPRLTMSGGLSVLHPSGVRGGLRGLHIAARPATEDEFLQAEPTTLIDLFAAYRWRSIELSVAIENLSNRRYKSAQFATVTRLDNEPSTNAPPPANACPAGTRAATDSQSGNFQGCEDVSFSPGNPFGARLMATYYF